MENTRQQAGTEDRLCSGCSICTRHHSVLTGHCKVCVQGREKVTESRSGKKGERWRDRERKWGEREWARERESWWEAEAGRKERERRISTPFYRSLSPRESECQVQNYLGIRRQQQDSNLGQLDSHLCFFSLEQRTKVSLRRIVYNKGAETLFCRVMRTGRSLQAGDTVRPAPAAPWDMDRREPAGVGGQSEELGPGGHRGGLN